MLNPSLSSKTLNFTECGEDRRHSVALLEGKDHSWIIRDTVFVVVEIVRQNASDVQDRILGHPLGCRRRGFQKFEVKFSKPASRSSEKSCGTSPTTAEFGETRYSLGISEKSIL